MAPVWLLVVATALIVVLATRVAGVWHLRRTTASSENTCSYAEIYLSSARQIVESQREIATKLRLETAQRNPQALAEPSLGILAGDPSLLEAREDLLRAAELCPALENIYYVRSLVEWYLGEPAAAYREMANYLRIREDYQMAVAAYEKALEYAPQDPRTILGLALAEERLGRVRSAVELIEPVMDEIVQLPGGEASAGIIMARSGQVEEARRHLETGLLKTPSDRKAVFALYDVYKRTDTIREGADFFMSLGEKGRKTIPEAYHHAYFLYRDAGDMENQLTALRKAVALASNNPDLRFQLATVLYRLGRYDEARDEVRRAAEIDLGAVMRGVDRVGFDPRKEP